MSDLDVLFPDREISVMGKKLLVRELRFGEQLACHHLLQPLADQLADQLDGFGTAMDGGDGVNQVYDMLASQRDAVIELVAISCSRTPQWVDALPPADGENLLLTWWAVNLGFFVRRAMRPKLVAMARMQQLAASDGEPSSPPSSQPDTTSTDSASTPNAS